MTRHTDDSSDGSVGSGAIGHGYASLQLAKALRTADKDTDPEVRDRARAKAARWHAVLAGLLSGDVAPGARTPVRDVPAWATLEVVTGGFATGELLAGGPLRAHERELLDRLSESGDVVPAEGRAAINASCLTEAGLDRMRARLREGTYEVQVAEEGMLLTVAWLVERGHSALARELVDELVPWFDRLRFYPVPRDTPAPDVGTVHVQDVAAARAALTARRVPLDIAAQKRAVEVWLPLHDRVVRMWLETLEGDGSALRFTDDWRRRAHALVAEHDEARRRFPPSRRHLRPDGHRAQLFRLLALAAREPAAIGEADMSRVRHRLEAYVRKRGEPDSTACVEARRAQRRDVEAPTYAALAALVAERLAGHPAGGGLEDVVTPVRAVTADEAARHEIPPHTPVPEPVARAVHRCLEAPLDTLVERGLVPSGEAVARLLRPLSSEAIAAGITDPELARLHAAIYRAFRARRSLLLVNLQSQVRLEELPWVAATVPWRRDGGAGRERTSALFDQVVSATFDAFPHAIVPNELVRELSALARTAGRDVPLVPEVAADIFMGEFSSIFVQAAVRAAELLQGTLYETYYDIDFAALEHDLADPGTGAARFSALCVRRAGVTRKRNGPATNGMIIEQQQILTTHGLASLHVALGPSAAPPARLERRAADCLAWVLARLAQLPENHHESLRAVKNAAYAWRQMIFFLSLLPEGEAVRFADGARMMLEARPEGGVRDAFRPALAGLSRAVHGHSPDGEKNGRRFVGWSDSGHWLLTSMSCNET